MTQTIGQRLKAKREEERLTLEKVFEATRIRLQYLEALESDDHSIMPSPVQARGYLRNYAEYLGIDAEQMLRELREVNGQQASEEVIGPADLPVSPPLEVKQEAADQPAAPAPESLDVVQGTPAADEPATLTKPKPARRKKAEAAPKPAVAEAPTKRRGRKKAVPEADPATKTQTPIEEEITSSVESVPQADVSDRVEAPIAPAESTPEPAAEAATRQEETEPSNVSDTASLVWQTWLNRVGSILSARARRRTLTPTESAVAEDAQAVSAPEPETAHAVEPQNQLPANSTQILKEIGKVLRQRRELLSLHFDEVERNTHVKAHYLDALERGALDELPSTVQTRGMLSNYATFLDLDVDTLLLRFADALQARHRERNPHKPARKPGQPILANMPPVRSFIAGDMIFGVGMVILLVGFAIWGVSRVMTVQSQQEIDPTSPSISDVLLSYPNPSSSTATPTFIAVEAFPGEATVTLEIPTQNVNAEVQLNLVAVERTYMRVVVDGEVAFEGRVVPGNAYPFEAENQVEVLVGSGAAIRIVYNGRDLGLMGTFGQVVNNIYLGTEIITPTALATVTPTITPTPTNTVPPTATSPFTATPVTSTPVTTATVAPSATAVP